MAKPDDIRFSDALPKTDPWPESFPLAATLLGPLPEIEVITVSVTELKPMTLELSAPVAAALPEVTRRVRALVDC